MMRLYIYIDKKIIKCLDIRNTLFDIDFFEYTERKSYSVNNNTSIRPEMDNCNKEKVGLNLSRVGVLEEKGTLSRIEVEKRYINFEDIITMRSNSFYYDILEKLKEDNRITKINGAIEKLDKECLFIKQNKYLIDSDAYEEICSIYENKIEVTCVGYKVNTLGNIQTINKLIAIYIE